MSEIPVLSMSCSFQDHLVPNGFEPPQPATILDVACDEGFNSSPKVSVPSQAVEDRLLSVTKVKFG